MDMTAASCATSSSANRSGTSPLSAASDERWSPRDGSSDAGNDEWPITTPLATDSAPPPAKRSKRRSDFSISSLLDEKCAAQAQMPQAASSGVALPPMLKSHSILPGYCITQPLLDLWQLTLARQAALAQASSTAPPTLVRAQTANIEEAKQGALQSSTSVTTNDSSVNGRKQRTVYQMWQIALMEKAFTQQQYMVGSDREHLAQCLGLTESQVRVWFQNRRSKQRKEQAEHGSKIARIAQRI